MLRLRRITCPLPMRFSLPLTSLPGLPWTDMSRHIRANVAVTITKKTWSKKTLSVISVVRILSGCCAHKRKGAAPSRPLQVWNQMVGSLARIFYELPAATADRSVLPGVLGYRILRRTVQVRLGSNPLRLPGGTPLSTVSRRQFVKYPGLPRHPSTSFTI